MSSKPQAALRLLEILKKLVLQRLEMPLSPRHDPYSESPSAAPPAPGALPHRLPFAEHRDGAARSRQEPCSGPRGLRASPAKALCEESRPYISAVARGAIPCRQGLYPFRFRPPGSGYHPLAQPPGTAAGGRYPSLTQGTEGHRLCHTPVLSVPWRGTPGWGAARSSPSPKGGAGMDLSPCRNTNDDAGREVDRDVPGSPRGNSCLSPLHK